MLWWFVILAGSTIAVLWASIAAYLRVKRHMRKDTAAMKRAAIEHDRS
jgi:hypothetical protein